MERPNRLVGFLISYGGHIMKLIRWASSFSCVLLFICGVLIDVENVDIRENRRMSMYAFFGGFLFVFMVFSMNYVIRMLPKNMRSLFPALATDLTVDGMVSSELWNGIGLSFISFMLGGVLGAIWKDGNPFWTGLVAGSLGAGFLAGLRVSNVVFRIKGPVGK